MTALLAVFHLLTLLPVAKTNASAKARPLHIPPCWNNCGDAYAVAATPSHSNINRQSSVTSGAAVLESLADGSVSIAMADRSGAFDFRNLAPGEYRAFAWSDLNKAEYRNPSFLARFKDKSKDITIDAQSPVSGVELSLIAATS